MPKLFLRTYWKSIAICIIIFILSSITFKSIPDVARFHNSDKFTHVLMYIGLGFIAYYEFLKDKYFKLRYRNWLMMMFVAFVLFGGIIEIFQGTIFKPRTSEFADWIADILGLILGMSAGWTLRKFLVKK